MNTEPNKEIPTPRADAEFESLIYRIDAGIPPNWSPEDAAAWMANFARQLERELAEKERERLSASNLLFAKSIEAGKAQGQLENLLSERDQLKGENERLKQQNEKMKQELYHD